MRQLRVDATFLASQNIMDYSLLLGVHAISATRTRPELALVRLPSQNLDDDSDADAADESDVDVDDDASGIALCA